MSDTAGRNGRGPARTGAIARGAEAAKTETAPGAQLPEEEDEGDAAEGRHDASRGVGGQLRRSGLADGPRGSRGVGGLRDAGSEARGRMRIRRTV
ncbi:hypothetical protein [Microbacterium sp. 1S1]|uniref:hypothetical protein n=1 Tax=Microbacterium sp. 1S1 TaxID=2606451 RepID=UPI0011EB0EA4|nr:hypothetical protein [Microbacterium sp. 1S1]